MATIKSYTDISQSKTLSKILPTESADMCYLSEESLFPKVNYNGMVFFNSEEEKPATIIPCWSLAALLSVLPKIINNETLFIATSAALWHISYKNIYTAIDDNLIDACVELIEKLHELKIL